MLTNKTEELKVLLRLESNTISSCYYYEEDFFGAVNIMKFFIESSENKKLDMETLKRLERKNLVIIYKGKLHTFIETTEQGYNIIKRLEALE